MRTLAASFGVAAALAALAACAPKADESRNRTITVWEQEDAAVAPFLDSVFERFKKTPGHADVSFARTHFNNEDLRQQFQTASIAGNPPDLLLTPPDPAGIYSVSGFILPVDDLFDLSAFTPQAVAAITLDGRTWGVPLSTGNHLLFYYNKRLAPSPPATTDELSHFCAARAKDLKLSSCWAFFEGEPFWLIPWLGAYGGWPLDGRKPTLDTPAMRSALGFLLDLKFKSREIPAECDYNCMDALFKEGKVAFIVNGDWALSTYRKQFGPDLGVSRIPRLSATGRWPTPMASGQYLLLSSKLEGPKLKLVKEFVAYASGKENELAQLKTLGRLPSLKSLAGSKELSDDPLLKASMEEIAVSKPMPMAPEMRAVWDAMRPYYAKALAQQMTPEEAAYNMQKEALAKIKEMGE